MKMLSEIILRKTGTGTTDVREAFSFPQNLRIALVYGIEVLFVFFGELQSCLPGLPHTKNSDFIYLVHKL